MACSWLLDDTRISNRSAVDGAGHVQACAGSSRLWSFQCPSFPGVTFSDVPVVLSRHTQASRSHHPPLITDVLQVVACVHRPYPYAVGIR